jgi:transposase
MLIVNEKMTTSPYSLDLRERVIKFIKSGNTQVLAASVFALNLSRVNKWYLRYQREGNCLPRKRLGAKSKLDQEALVNYISSNPDTKLKDLSKKFGLSIWGIYYWLCKLGFSYKKKPLPMWKQARKSDQST